MATWKDGAAYAPVERPDGFATPRADALPVAEPYSSGTPGPGAAPGGFQADPQRPLEQLGTPEQRGRDGRDSFAVSTMALTAGQPATEARDPRTPFETSSSASAPTSELPPPPTGRPLSDQSGRPLPPPGSPLAGVPGGPAQPGQQHWGPPGQQGGLPQYIGQYGGQPGQPPAKAPDQAQRRLAQVAGGLAFGGFLLSFAAPFILLVIGALGLRTRSMTGHTGTVALVMGAGLVVYGLFNGSLGQSNWVFSLISFGFSLAFFIGSMRNT